MARKYKKGDPTPRMVDVDPKALEGNRGRPLETIGPRDLEDGPSEEGYDAFKSDSRHLEARSGADYFAQQEAERATFGAELRGGDLDASLEDAAMVGDAAPGGGNASPDQDVVDEIGRAYGIEYDDNEQLRPAGKVEKRDEHRWELHPASSEDFAERANELTNLRAHRTKAQSKSVKKPRDATR